MKILKKNLIRDDNNESIYYALRSEFDGKDKQKTNNIDTKPLNVFDYLKSLSQKAKSLVDEIEEGDDGIDDDKLLFIGSNKENFNFNTSRKSLNFIPAIING